MNESMLEIFLVDSTTESTPSLLVCFSPFYRSDIIYTTLYSRGQPLISNLLLLPLGELLTHMVAEFFLKPAPHGYSSPSVGVLSLQPS